jgi:hypothetical protein
VGGALARSAPRVVDGFGLRRSGTSRLIMAIVFMLPALNRWIKNMHHYDLGINESTFQYLATFYTSVLNALDIGLGLVFCECSEDESACQDDPRWNERRDELVGF